MTQKKTIRSKYRTTNWAHYNAALKARESLTMWLDRGMQWLGAPRGKRGRSQTFSDAASQFCLSIKCLYSQPLRQALGMVHSLLKLAGLDWPVPDFSTVCRRQKSWQVALSYCPRTTPLHLLLDSTGIKFLGEGECKRKKHGAHYRREWRKVNLAIDAQTLEIRAIEVTTNAIGDAPMLPELLTRIPEDEPIASVSADGTYDTRACLDVIANRGAKAVIPPLKNASILKRVSPGSNHRNEAVRACKRFVRRIWKAWSVYHRRSLVETKMHCFKCLGKRVTARTFERQVVELHIRVALLNRFS